jgi:hypothetical protein
MRRTNVVSYILSVLVALPFSVLLQARPETALHLYVYTTGDDGHSGCMAPLQGAPKGQLQFQAVPAADITLLIAPRKSIRFR